MELDVSHDARVGVGEGEVADIGPVLLRQVVRSGKPALSTGKSSLDHLAQLQVESHYDGAVEPGPEPGPLGVWLGHSLVSNILARPVRSPSSPP